MINLIDINPESPFADMQRQYNERQKQWYSLTPEQQEAERKIFTGYDTRLTSEDDHE